MESISAVLGTRKNLFCPIPSFEVTLTALE